MTIGAVIRNEESSALAEGRAVLLERIRGGGVCVLRAIWLALDGWDGDRLLRYGPRRAQRGGVPDIGAAGVSVVSRDDGRGESDPRTGWNETLGR